MLLVEINGQALAGGSTWHQATKYFQCPLSTKTEQELLCTSAYPTYVATYYCHIPKVCSFIFYSIWSSKMVTWCWKITDELAGHGRGFVSDVTMKTRLGIVPWFYDQIWVNKNWMGHVRNQFLETGGFIIKQGREGSNIIQHLHMIWPLIDGIVAAALDFR